VGLAAGGGLLRIVFVPRLSGQGTVLAAYGLADWVALVAAATVRVQARAAHGAVVAAHLAARSPGSADGWRGFFPAGTAGREWVGQPTYGSPVVIPTASHAERGEGAYRDAAKAPGDDAAVQDGLTKLDALGADEPPPPFDPGAPTFRDPD